MSDQSQKLPDLLQMDLGKLLSGGKLRPKKLSLLCAQLAISLKAGMPLVDALELAAKNEPDPQLKSRLTRVASDVRSGIPLSEAFQKNVPKLPAAFLETLRAGEASGGLDAVFHRLSQYYGDSAALAAKVSTAMLYPTLLLVVSVAVIAAIMVFAVPVFAQSFADLGSELPLATRLLIAISGFCTENALLLTIFTAMAIVGCSLFAKTPRGQRILGRMALHFPGIGQVTRMQAAAQLAATLSSLLSSGLPLAQALEVTAATMENPLIGQALHAACQGVTAGQSLAEELRKCAFLPRLLTELTAVGEETGQLEQTLSIVSGHFTQEVDDAVKRALAILEPCITLVLAGLVMFILLSVYLPIFRMYNHL